MNFKIIKYTIKLALLSAAIGLLPNSTPAQNGVAPRTDYQAIINGNIAIGGDSLLVCNQSGFPECGMTLRGQRNGSNNDLPPGYMLIDAAGVGGGNASSSFTFELPTGAVVQRAILYHSFFDSNAFRDGSVGSFGIDLPATAGFAFNELPTSGSTFSTSYITVVGQPVHQNRWDITTLVAGQGGGNASGAYTFRSSRVTTNGNSTALIAEWHLYLIYTVAGSTRRSITVIDGHSNFGGDSGRTTLDVPVNSLVTPVAGAIRGEAGLIVTDGDQNRTSNGEFLQFGRNATSLNTLSNAANPVNNPYNSTITVPGTPNPSFVNNLNVDIDAFDVGSLLTNSQTQALFRLNSDSASEGVAFALAYLSIDNVPVTDFGDAPDSYRTTIQQNGALHGISTNLRLGAATTDETDGQPGAAASGDGASDDGVASFPPLNASTTSYTVSVSAFNATGRAANLYSWIDFDRSGTFDADERVVTSVPTGTNGAVSVTFNSFPGFADGMKYARFRLTTDTLTTGTGAVSDAAAQGSASDGEVEDYVLAATTTAATVSIGGRVLTPDGRGLVNASVTLTDRNGTPRTVSTTSFGYFNFPEVQTGEIVIITVVSKRYDFAAQVFNVAEESNELQFVAQSSKKSRLD